LVPDRHMLKSELKITKYVSKILDWKKKQYTKKERINEWMKEKTNKQTNKQ
jgi:serine protease inhibitor